MQGKPTKILFITSTRIGDAILSSGILGHLLSAHPGAEATIVCGPLAESLFAGVCEQSPGARIVVLRKRSWNRHWIALWRQVVGTRWDIVVDLRNSAVSRLIRAGVVHRHGPHISASLHKAEQNAAILGLTETPPLRLFVSEAQARSARDWIPDGGPVLGVCPTSNWIGKTWPVERFIELVARLTGPYGMMPGARVAVFGAPGEEAEARKLLESLPEGRGLDVIARGDPGTAAATIARCAFYIGNDSGLLHCAAAAGIPTLGLYGPTHPEIYRPWGAKAAFVRTPERCDELIGYPGYHPTKVGCLMGTLEVETVEAAARRLWATTRPALSVAS